MSPFDFLAPIAALPSIDPKDHSTFADQMRMAPAADGASFSDLVTQGLQQVNDGLLASQVDMQSLAAGNAGNLHQMMIRLEESRLSFQLMIQIRNRALESYQELMRMQI